MSLHFDPTAGLIVVPTRLCGPAGDTVVRFGARHRGDAHGSGLGCGSAGGL